MATVLVVVAVEEFSRGEQRDWLLPSIALLFAISGVAAVVALLRQLVLFTGIGPTAAEISDHPLLPGHTYEIHVTQAGQLRVNSFAVSLVCEEVATYHQ